MVKQKCQKCGKTWHGWAQPDIFPGGVKGVRSSHLT